MKGTSKKLLAVLLSAMLGLSAIMAASAAETDDISGAAVTAAVEETNEAAETTEPAEATEAIEAIEATEAAEVTEPETQPATRPATEPAKPAEPVIGRVTGVDKTNYDSDCAKLTWNRVSGVTGYTVYYMNKDKDKAFTKYADVKTNAVTIKNLAHTTPYDFKIVPYVIKDGKRYNGPETIKKTAVNPPAVKVYLSSRLRSDNVVKFNWTRNTRADGYKIYRKSYQTKGEFVLYKTIKGNQNNVFTDTNVEVNRGYYYIIRSYRTVNGGYTYHSPATELRMFTGLSSPNFSTSTQLSKITLSWSKNKYASGYDIYSSTSKDSGYTKIATTTSTSYTTSKLTNGKTYYYRVVPFKYHGGDKNNKIQGTWNTKSQTVSNKIYGKDPGNSYVEISIAKQHMWVYKNGKLVVETDVVTGNDDGYHNTPRGYHTMFRHIKDTYLYGADYTTHVDYWMAFCGGCGIHDAQWRANWEYGGTTYKGNGSHGCVNTPLNAVKKVYDNTKVGTPVIVY